MEYKVSVVVPVFNVEEYLHKCINSLLNQTLKEIEIILIDDGSIDKSSFICDFYSENYENIKVIHKKNEGLGMACNTGLNIATGKYIAFLDSDDWVDKEMYETMYKNAVENNAEMVFTGIRRVFEDGKTENMYKPKVLKRYNSLSEINKLILGMIASSPSSRIEREVPMSAKIVLYNRDFIIANHITFENERIFLSEDLLFNLDLLFKAKCVIEIPYIFYNYFVNFKSLSMSIKLDRFSKALHLYNELLYRYKDVSKEYYIRIARLFIGYSRQAIIQISLANSFSLKERLRLIKEICSNSIWQKIKNEYPISDMPLFHRIFLYFILNHNIFALYLISVVKK